VTAPATPSQAGRAGADAHTVSRATVTTSGALVLGVIMCSVAGLAWRSGDLYPQDSGTVLVSRAGDAANLLVAAPALAAATWSARRGSLLGLLCWPGALFYLFYVYVIYSVAAPLTALTFLHLGIALASLWALARLLADIPATTVAGRLSTPPVRWVGYGLVAVAGLAYAGLIATGLTMLQESDQLNLRPQWVVDCLIGTPALLAPGYLLLRRHPLGYVTVTGAVLVSGIGGLAYVLAATLDPVLADRPSQPAVIAVHAVVTLLDAALLTVVARQLRHRGPPVEPGG
jgi:hypothetical protein